MTLSQHTHLLKHPHVNSLCSSLNVRLRFTLPLSIELVHMWIRTDDIKGGMLWRQTVL